MASRDLGGHNDRVAHPQTDRPSPTLAARIAGWVGLLGHVAVGFFYAASGLLAPPWAVIVLLVTWTGLLVLAIVLLRRRPAWTLLVPAAAVLIWFAAMSAGDAWLNWTA
jgi:hypothetical protein